MSTPSTSTSTSSTSGQDEPGGRILLRVPKSLHRQLVDKAREEGVSLNQFLLYLLAMGLAEWSPKSVAKQKLRAAMTRGIKSGLLPERSTYIPAADR